MGAHPPLTEEEEVHPKAVSASSTRWGTVFRFLHLSNPYAANHVLVADPARLWDSGQMAGTVSLTFEFDERSTVAGVAIQHAVVLWHEEEHHHHHSYRSRHHHHQHHHQHTPGAAAAHNNNNNSEEEGRGGGVWRAIEAWASSLQPHPLVEERFEGVCYDRGWTMLRWPKPVQVRHLTLRITAASTAAASASIALRRVRFLRHVKPARNWWAQHHDGDVYMSAPSHGAAGFVCGLIGDAARPLLLFAFFVILFVVLHLFEIIVVAFIINININIK